MTTMTTARRTSGPMNELAGAVYECITLLREIINDEECHCCNGSHCVKCMGQAALARYDAARGRKS